MTSLCLSRQEVRELTRTPIRKRQVAFLMRNGIRHYIDAYGWPVVLRQMVMPESTKPTVPEWRSNKAP
jgi:hypothetical protein